MPNFSSLCNEEVHIKHADGRETGPCKTTFSNNKFTIFDETLDVSEGDVVDRPLPNGKAERYDVVEVNYQHKFHSIPAHASLKVRKQGALVPFMPAKTVNISINNSQGVQVGDHNTQSITIALQELVQLIDSSDASLDEKTEVKSRLSKFLEHPLTTSIIGGVSGGLTGIVNG